MFCNYLYLFCTGNGAEKSTDKDASVTDTNLPLTASLSSVSLCIVFGIAIAAVVYRIKR